MVDKKNEELAQAWKLELVQTKEEMERLSKELLELNWTKFETAPSGGIICWLIGPTKGAPSQDGIGRMMLQISMKVVLSF